MSATTASRASKKLGNFDVLEQIGEGGMGVVLLARQPALERLVVLKKIREELAMDPSAVERFEREARAAAGVHHQNVVAVYDCFAVRDDHYIAQEYVDGKDLRTVLARLGRLDPNVAHLVALEVARALEEIHARGIVHRDLKPSNILLSTEGATKVADFGIALESNGEGLTRPGTLVGSVPYLSPEQLLGERIDSRSDIFLFGILLYEMLTGVPPYRESNGDETDTLLERMQRGLYVPPRRLVRGLPGHLVRLIRGCLKARPAKRIPSATHVRRRLERRLGSISPADCRAAIAEYLWARGVFEATGERTRPEPVPHLQRAARSLSLARAIPAGTAVLAAAFVLAGYGFGIQSRKAAEVPVERARPVPSAQGDLPGSRPPSPGTRVAAAGAGLERPAPLPVPEPERAHVRFVAHPWAEVRLEDGRKIVTPSASSVDIPPGRRTIVFEHPRFGARDVVVDLAPGEERTVSFDFEASPPS
jgi:serine/threonine-protein kinase